MGAEIEVEISNTQSHLRVDTATLQALVRAVLAAENRSSASISIALVDNAAIHAVNRTHLAHDWPTDVISFPLSAPEDPVLTGELVISAEMACTSAHEIGAQPDDELALYVVHGLLHLCGFDDHDGVDAQQMHAREDELLSQAGLTRPYDGGVETVPGPPEQHAVGPRLFAHKLERQQWTP
jgi:probable rRNA maturation factor